MPGARPAHGHGPVQRGGHRPLRSRPPRRLWLVWGRRLFGVRGGAEAARAEQASRSLLELEHTAA